MPKNITKIVDAFYDWLNEIADSELFTEEEYGMAERSWWGDYYAMAQTL